MCSLLPRETPNVDILTEDRNLEHLHLLLLKWLYSWAQLESRAKYSNEIFIALIQCVDFLLINWIIYFTYPKCFFLLIQNWQNILNVIPAQSLNEQCILMNNPCAQILIVSWNRWLAILIIPQATESTQRSTFSKAVFARNCENMLLPMTGSYVIVHFILHKDLVCPTLNFLTIQKILLFKLCFINMLIPPLPLPSLSISHHINTAGKVLWF